MKKVKIEVELLVPEFWDDEDAEFVIRIIPHYEKCEGNVVKLLSKRVVEVKDYDQTVHDV